MNVATAFIYGIVTALMGGNLIYCLVDMKRMRQESKRLDKMGDDILEDIEIGKHYMEASIALSERLDKIEEKVNSLESKEKTKTTKSTKKTKEE